MMPPDADDPVLSADAGQRSGGADVDPGIQQELTLVHTLELQRPSDTFHTL